jgi:hypothetical protein
MAVGLAVLGAIIHSKWNHTRTDGFRRRTGRIQYSMKVEYDAVVSIVNRIRFK